MILNRFICGLNRLAKSDQRQRRKGNAKPTLQRPKRFRPELELLEHRVVPVINADASFPIAMPPGAGYDDIVQVFSPGGAGTGTLLNTGRHILTAAHVVDANGDGVVDFGNHMVQFDMPGRAIQLSVSQANVTVGPGWNGNFDEGSDIAIIRLDELSPFVGTRRNIFRDNDEVGNNFVFVGYGGTNRRDPNTGAVLNGNNGGDGSFGTKRSGFNQVDRFVVSGGLQPTDWYLRFDLDSPTSPFGLGTAEAISSQGDSGGPLFIRGQIAGVSSGGTTPMQFGGIADYTRVRNFASWIDQTVSGTYELVLDMRNQLVGNNGSSDNIELRRDNNLFYQLLVNGVSYQFGLASQISSIRITGSNDDDVVHVAADLGKLVQLDGWGGSNYLIVENATGASTADLAAGVLDVRTGGRDTVASYTRFQRLAINGDSNDTVRVNATRFETPVSVIGAGSVNVGGGFLQNIQGRVSIIGRSVTNLSLNDASNTNARAEYTVYANMLVATPTASIVTIDYADLGSLTINCGSGGNFVLVDNTPLAPVTLNTGTGVDSMRVAQTTGPLVVNGQDSRIPNSPDGFDTVNIGLNGSVRNIRSGLTLTNVGAYSAVTVDNSADPVARTGIIYKNGLYNVISGLTPNGDIVLRGRDLRSLTILAGNGGNAFRIHDTPTSNTPGGLTTTLVTGTVTDMVTVNGTTGALAVNNRGDFDTITVGSATVGLDRILGAVSISGQFSTNTVIIHDRPTTANRTLTHTITASAYTRTGAATINLSNVHSFILQAGSAADTINVQGNPTLQFFSSFDILSGPGNDILNVGTAANRLAGIGTVTTLDGEAGSDALNLYDQGSTAPKTYTFGFNFGLASMPFFSSPDAQVSHFNNESVLVRGGSGGNTIQVQDLSATTVIYPGVGNDLIHVGTAANTLDTIRLLNIVDQGGADQLVMRDQGQSTPRLYSSDLNFGLTFGGLSARPMNGVGNSANVFFAGIESVTLNAGSGADFFRIAGVPIGTTLSVNAGLGADTIDVGSYPNEYEPGNSLNRILGPLTIDGQGGLDQLTFNDQGTVAAENYTLYPGVISTTFASPDYHYAGIETLTINGSAGANNFGFSYNPGPVDPLITLNGGGGSNVLAGPHVPNLWRITGTNAGLLNTNINFASMQSFYGGADDDTFVFLNGASIAGSISGQGGINTLDYSAYPASQIVPGLVSWYKGEGNADDAVGGNHGTLVGGVGFDPGKVGYAFSFDDNYVDLGNDPSLDIPGSLTVEAWVNIQNLTELDYLIADFDPSGHLSQGSLGILANHFYWFQTTDNGAVQIISGATTLDAGQWYHVAVVRDDVSKNVKMYVNGLQDGSVNYIGTVVGLQQKKVLGTSTVDFPGDFFHGLIDEPSIYNRALSAGDIQSIFAADSAGKASLSSDGVRVNLTLGTATSINGGIQDIQNVIGSAGNDILVGNGGNVLSGGLGRDLLIAGALASFLNGGGDDDILIGGTTNYDSNQAALNSIMTEWARTDIDYDARVANLLSGVNGVPALNANTVHSNGGTNQLRGESARDLLFAALASELLDWDSLTEQWFAIV